MKNKSWESSIPQVPNIKNRKRLFRRWKKVLNKNTYTHWIALGYRWLTPREVTFYNLLDDYKLEEILSKELLNEAKMIFPLDSAEWIMHK